MIPKSKQRFLSTLHNVYFLDHVKMNEALNLTIIDPKGPFRCSDGTYLPAWHWRCDGRKDCINGTDEENCDSKYICSNFSYLKYHRINEMLC